ncbi:MAG: hypothetical protein HZB81_04410 [Deltaproteobacteria bacterium]|nr:hypothetical protein [Deltaproteobacteria bacterium]
MLVTCPECSNKVSHAAVLCPQCGLNKPGEFCEEKAMEKAKLYKTGMKYGACFDHLLNKIYNLFEFASIGGSKPTYITDIQVVKVSITKGEGVVGSGYDVELTVKCKSCGKIMTKIPS